MNKRNGKAGTFPLTTNAGGTERLRIGTVRYSGENEVSAHKVTTPLRGNAEARGALYRLLSTFFLGPPQLDVLHGLLDSQVLDQLGSELGEEAVADLRESAASFDSAGDLAVLKKEYADLCAVLDGTYVAPFGEFRSALSADGDQGRGLLLGPRAVVEHGSYGPTGAESNQMGQELVTRAGVDLSFMNFLCVREASMMVAEEETPPGKRKERDDLASAYRYLQRWYLQQHLTPWLGQLGQALQVHAATSFYRGLGALTERFLTNEASLVAAFSEADTGNVPVIPRS